MAEIHIRPANRSDLPRLTEIYNYFVVNTPVTFDVEPTTVERRAAWFEQFALMGRYRLLVAEERGLVVCAEPNRTYRLGPSALMLGAKASRQIDLVAIARPFLARLGEQVQETTQLRVPDGVTLLDDPEETVLATVTLPTRVEEPEVEVEEGEELAEGEEPEAGAEAPEAEAAAEGGEPAAEE